MNSELTTFLNEDRKSRLMANIARRAARLFEVGYTATETLSGLYVRLFQVVSPEGKRYNVKISKTDAAPGSFYGSRCSCPCFNDHNTCKHLQGLELKIAQEEAQEDAFEAQQNNDDDPYAEF